MAYFYNRFWLLLYGVWMAAIIALSLHSDPPQVRMGVLGWDKLQHAAAYALLTFLGWMAFRSVRRPAGGVVPSALIALFLGAALEIGQGWLTPTRLADVWDLVADGVGAGAILFFVLVFSSRRAK